MKERLVFWPFVFGGTIAASSGTAIIVPPTGLSFRSGGLFIPTAAGGTVTVKSAATGQGTATLAVSASGGGSCYIGTAATNASASGSVLNTLYIPKGGSVIISGSAGTSAGTATQMSGYVVFEIGEA
jgi:hypothetical protein